MTFSIIEKKNKQTNKGCKAFMLAYFEKVEMEFGNLFKKRNRKYMLKIMSCMW